MWCPRVSWPINNQTPTFVGFCGAPFPTFFIPMERLTALIDDTGACIDVIPQQPEHSPYPSPHRPLISPPPSQPVPSQSLPFPRPAPCPPPFSLDPRYRARLRSRQRESSTRPGKVFCAQKFRARHKCFGHVSCLFTSCGCARHATSGQTIFGHRTLDELFINYYLNAVDILHQTCHTVQDICQKPFSGTRGKFSGTGFSRTQKLIAFSEMPIF